MISHTRHVKKLQKIINGTHGGFSVQETCKTKFVNKNFWYRGLENDSIQIFQGGVTNPK